ALSQAFGLGETREVRWETAEQHGPALVDRLIKQSWGAGILLNVNFPDVPPGEVVGVEVTDQGKRDQGLLMVDERIDARGNCYYWLGFERRRSNPPRGSDLRAVYDGYISVTPLHMNLTHTDSKADLARLLRDDDALTHHQARRPRGGGT